MALKNKTHDPQRLAIQRKPKPVARIENDQDVSHRPGSLERIIAKSPATLRPADVLTLQRTVGNRAVQRMLSNRPHSLSSFSSTSAQTIQRQAEEEEPLQAKFDVVSPQSKLVQGKFNVVQRQDPPEEAEEPLQGKFVTSGVIQRFPVTVEARGAADRFTGATSMTAKVGGESEWRFGTRPWRGVPTLITRVGHFIQGTQRYIAGHLLNQNMSGRGVNNNLTVLTTRANQAHRGVEGKVKDLAQKADLINAGNTTFGDPAYDHGARYTVRVLPPQLDGETPFSESEKHIGAGLRIHIKPIRIHKISQVESPWPQEVRGANHLRGLIITNVPPYPAVPEEKVLTPIQVDIMKAILRSRNKSYQGIWSYIQGNVAPCPTERRVKLALKKGRASRFFLRRGPHFRVAKKLIQ